MSSSQPHQNRDEGDDDMLDENEIDEVVPDDPDAPMEEDDDEEGMDGEPIGEIEIQNDSVAHFDGHKDSIFCIAQHPAHPQIIATGGGDDMAYIWDATPPEKPLLPTSYEANPQPKERKGAEQVAKLEGHTDSINAVAFTLPAGEYVATAGLDGRLKTWHNKDASGRRWAEAGEAQEVDEINWLAPCPNPQYPNTVALGASDGSVWVYTLDKENGPTIVQTFYIHTGPCTAGAWTPDGKLLATVSEDASFYVWDVFGDAAAAGLASAAGSQAVVGMTGEDERFRIEGGLYSVAVSPGGTLAAVGGTEGQIRVVGLPRLSTSQASTGSTSAGARSKVGGGKQAGGPKGAAVGASAGQAGQILASLGAGSDSVETISFAQPPLTLMAAGNVDGSITVFDVTHGFAVRRSIPGAHTEDEVDQAVIKVEFLKNGPQNSGSILTSCGNDGVVRRWDTKGGTAAANKGLVGEWRGHRGGGEGGGVMGFVQGGGGANVVTAGDDGVALVFSTPLA